MKRDQALEQLKLRIFNKNLIKHSLAVEAIMGDLAEYFDEDIEKWKMAGLMHDIDYERTVSNPSLHSIIGADILETLGFDDSIVYAVKAHNGLHGIHRKRKIDKALYSVDPLSGLIVACALVLPSKKLEDVTVDFVINKINEKSFAKGANRDQIKECVALGVSFEKFIEISLNALKKISDQLEL